MKQIAMGILLLAWLLSWGCSDNNIKEIKNTITGFVGSDVNENEMSPKARKLKIVCEDENADEYENAYKERNTTCDRLSEMFLFGINVKQNTKIANKYHRLSIKKAIKFCENGVIEACHGAAERINLGDYHANVVMIDPKFFNNALPFYKKACLSGQSQDCYVIGNYYKHYNKYDKAIEYYKLGCSGSVRSWGKDFISTGYVNQDFKESSCYELENLQ